jgi:predicted acetyltransferase
VSLEIRACGRDDLPAALSPIFHYFGRTPSQETMDRFGPLLPPDRVHAAFERGSAVGSGGVFPFETSVPGGFVRAAGITLVGVLPTHRRRGILRQLMRAQLDDVHERGEPMAYLWASEDVLYGRFGYGIASFTGSIELPLDRSAFHADAPSAAARFRPVDVDEAIELFSGVQRRAAAHHPGMFVRTPEWWRHKRLPDPEAYRQGGGEMNRVLLELDGRPAGYALYRLHWAHDGGIASGFVNVIEAVGDSREATASLWRYLLDTDWMASAKADLLPLDHELLLLLAEPRRARFRLRDGLWVRLVDVGAALRARTYRVGAPVVLDVVDDFCPWNAGRWRVGPDGIERTADAADLALPVAALGSAYLGGFTFGELARAARIEQLTDGALARADALFGADRYPWCPEIF